LRIFFRKFFSPHYTLKKAGFDTTPFALKNCRKFCSLLYAGKTGFLHPPPAHIFQKIFYLSLYADKIAIYQPPVGRFCAKNLPFTIRWQKRLLATPFE
jgi:hypothetical protein